MRADAAIDVFLRSFAFTRSFTAPAEFVREGSAGELRVVRDVRGDTPARSEEIFAFAWALDAKAVLKRVRAYVEHANYRLCVFHRLDQTPDAVRASYKPLGFRPRVTETLFVRPLTDLPTAGASFDIQRVTTPEQHEHVRAVTRYRQLNPEHVADPKSPVRLYYIDHDGKAAAMVRSVHLQKQSSYVAGLWTLAEHRRRGMATALMCRMLADDAASGAKHSVLMASTAGALLYPKLGYVPLAQLQVFTPLRG